MVTVPNYQLSCSHKYGAKLLKQLTKDSKSTWKMLLSPSYLMMYFALLSGISFIGIIVRAEIQGPELVFSAVDELLMSLITFSLFFNFGYGLYMNSIIDKLITKDNDMKMHADGEDNKQ